MSRRSDESSSRLSDERRKIETISRSGGSKEESISSLISDRKTKSSKSTVRSKKSDEDKSVRSEQSSAEARQKNEEKMRSKSGSTVGRRSDDKSKVSRSTAENNVASWKNSKSEFPSEEELNEDSRSNASKKSRYDTKSVSEKRREENVGPCVSQKNQNKKCLCFESDEDSDTKIEKDSVCSDVQKHILKVTPRMGGFIKPSGPQSKKTAQLSGKRKVLRNLKNLSYKSANYMNTVLPDDEFKNICDYYVDGISDLPKPSQRKSPKSDASKLKLGPQDKSSQCLMNTSTKAVGMTLCTIMNLAIGSKKIPTTDLKLTYAFLDSIRSEDGGRPPNIAGIMDIIIRNEMLSQSFIESKRDADDGNEGRNTERKSGE